MMEKLFSFLLMNSGKISMEWQGSFFERLTAPDIITTNAHEIDNLFWYTTYLNIFWFLLVCIGLFGFSYLYYYKRNKKPEYTYGNKRSQLLITAAIGALVFLSVDLMITKQSNDDMIAEFWNFPDHSTEDTVKIEVLAQQWMWNFRYAGKDGEFNTGDDVISNHDLRIPVGKKVEFRITSKDVIHSFYFPNARLKVDAIPGRITRLWFQPTKTGRYDIACAEMCGTHHYQMQAKLTVHTPEDFDRWLAESQQLALIGNDMDNLDNYWGWKWGE